MLITSYQTYFKFTINSLNLTPKHSKHCYGTLRLTYCEINLHLQFHRYLHN